MRPFFGSTAASFILWPFGHNGIPSLSMVMSFLSNKYMIEWVICNNEAFFVDYSEEVEGQISEVRKNVFGNNAWEC